ncbi:hypothetical protein OZX67_02135 [Bifidobacterium sp. ESL0728]|uniref:hypothetical protein n=1 Tax=Bifidobacterium sp. ESL0728 TaxID=2983220 RepID=UPI0023F821DB|nr:hypothetical protein [Bifidobacterium sp. ESL0728]WEV59384.1 hypothetical protein OZX67_02135 [Bifidobacterium sp. ESL0728]
MRNSIWEQLKDERKKKRMTLLVAFLLIIIAQIIARIDRGYIEHRIASGNLINASLMQKVTTSNIDSDLLDSGLVVPRMGLNMTVLPMIRVVVPVAIGYGLSLFKPTLIWLWSTLAAIYVAALPLIDKFMVRASNNKPSKIPMKAGEICTVLISDILAAIVLERTFDLGYSTSCVFHRLQFHWIWWLLFAIVFLIGLWIAYAIARFGGRLSKRFASSHFELEADDRFVLYLRSFRDEHVSVEVPVGIAEFDCNTSLRGVLWPRISFEEMLSNVVAAGVGDLITVGKPGELLPKAGAARSYYKNDDWQENVRVTAFRSKNIIVALGITDSLKWEIAHLKEWGLLAKCLFVVPPDNEKRTKERVKIAFDALGVNKNEYEELDDMPVFIIAGFSVKPDGSVHWFWNFGRDWSAYLSAVNVFEARTEMVEGQENDAMSSEALWDDLEAEQASGPIAFRSSGNPGKRQIQPDLSVRATIVSSTPAKVLTKQRRWDEAVQKYAKLIEKFDEAHQGEVFDDFPVYYGDEAQSIVYLLYHQLEAEGKSTANYGGQFLLLADRLITNLHSSPKYVWLSSMETQKAVVVETEVNGLVADYARDKLEDSDLEIKSRKEQVEAAERTQDQRIVMTAQSALYLALHESSERVDAARARLESAIKLGDVRSQATNHLYIGLGLAEQGADRSEWEPELRMASKQFKECGETENAQGALDYIAKFDRNTQSD